MSPAKSHVDEHARRVIHSARPSPLRISKGSLVIQKPPSSFMNSQQNPSLNNQQRNPVIIYTHSPKIIHTQARDFMALVQKLTGLSRPDVEPKIIKTEDDEGDNGSSSVLTDENCGAGDFKESLSSINPYFDDIPLYTPNSNDFFCSPHLLFGRL